MDKVLSVTDDEGKVLYEEKLMFIHIACQKCRKIICDIFLTEDNFNKSINIQTLCGDCKICL